MGEPLQIDVLTVFPGMLRGFLEESMLRRAARQGAVVFRTVDLRDFARDARRTADDRPYGGGPGMIMKPELWFEAIEAVRTPGARVILMTPSGETFRQAEARRLAKARHLIFVCGHYEGIDDRVRAALVTDELSIGDYVLTNGVLPAAVVVDAVVRLLPGVLGGGERRLETSPLARTVWNTRSTRARRCIAGWRCQRCCRTATMPRWRPGASGRRWTGRRNGGRICWFVSSL